MLEQYFTLEIIGLDIKINYADEKTALEAQQILKEVDSNLICKITENYRTKIKEKK